MTRQPVVLVIEDDGDIGRALQALLNRAGYQVVLAGDGRDGLRLFHAVGPSIVVLDIALPSLDGWTILDRIRELSHVPVLMLTARSDEMDKVRGLRGGADDYITKPFGNQELLARIEAILRREEARRQSAEPGGHNAALTSFSEAGVVIDVAAHRVEVDGREVDLTPIEFNLLETLMRHRGTVLSTEQLLQQAWRDPTATGPDRVKFAMLRLRRKLGWSGAGQGPIETVRGFGYRFANRAY
ncbi:MAG: response regulator transcription factor [Acidimicrobiales bacterium]